MTGLTTTTASTGFLWILPQNPTNWPKLPTIENFPRETEGKIIDALFRIFHKECGEAYEREKLRSPKTISNTRGVVIRPADDLGNRSAADLGLGPRTYREAQRIVNRGQAGTVFGADGRLHIFLNNKAFLGPSQANGYASLDDVLKHEFIHEGLESWPDPTPIVGGLRHDLAGFPGYDRIMKGCR